jgi:hypothetical protein
LRIVDVQPYGATMGRLRWDDKNQGENNI